MCICHKHSASELSVYHSELMSEIRLRQSCFTKSKHENMLIYSMWQVSEEAQSKETNVICQRIKTGRFYLR